MASTLIQQEVLDTLDALLATPWFYNLDLLGTFAFAVSGMIKAYKIKYDWFGAFLLAVLPAVGGGRLRDLLIGDGLPFIFTDPIYIYIVFSVVIGGILLARIWHPGRHSAPLNTALNVFDTVGVAAFTVIGAKAAIAAGLSWYWAPIMAALTCSGGSILSNAITGHESEVLKGELYEEIAFAGGLFMVLAFAITPYVPFHKTFMSIVVLVSLVGTFSARWWVIKSGLRCPTVGGAVQRVMRRAPSVAAPVE